MEVFLFAGQCGYDVDMVSRLSSNLLGEVFGILTGKAPAIC